MVAMADETELRLGLKLLCFRAVRKHFSALGAHATTVLPCGLLEELQLHLTVCQLDHLQPALNRRGVSTLSAWREILRLMRGPSSALDVSGEEEAKHLVMKGLFSSVLYDFKSDFINKNLSNLNTSWFLGTAARCLRHFILLNMVEPLRRLTGEHRAVLELLERSVSSVGVSHSLDPDKAENQLALLVLHRLLDHGQARRVVLQARCPITLAWILHGRSSQTQHMPEKKTHTFALCWGPRKSSHEDQEPVCKRLRVDHRKRDGGGQVDPKLGQLSHGDGGEVGDSEGDRPTRVVGARPGGGGREGSCGGEGVSGRLGVDGGGGEGVGGRLGVDGGGGEGVGGRLGVVGGGGEGGRLGEVGGGDEGVGDRMGESVGDREDGGGREGGSGSVGDRLGEGVGGRVGEDGSESVENRVGGRISPEACPRGHIESLELRQCQVDCLRVLLCALPSWSSLRSLTLHSYTLFSQSAVVELSRALQEQSRAGGGVTQLSISTLPCPSLLEQLLEACPRLLSFSVEVHSIVGPSGARGLSLPQNHFQFPLQKLSVSLNQQLFPRLLLPSLLQCCPQLCSLHVCGLRLQTGASYGQLITSLTECCGGLRCLSLEDVNLSDCLEHILLLLRHCQLHELCLKDCRLMEKWNNKEDSLQRLITALAAHNTLQSLSLAHNRIARHVPVLAQLFSAPRSVLQRLDLSSNFIQPEDLLEFSERLRALRSGRRITLDLRRNPGDRDPHTWSVAISSLSLCCHLLLEGWKSTDTMVDHISNM